jgi:transcriptional regulator with XRE-family HTH domain
MPRLDLPDQLAAKVGSRLRSLRAERGMSMSKMAREAGLSKGHLANVERGLAQATVGTLVAAARALGVAPSMLLIFPGEEPLGAVLEHMRVNEDEAVQKALLAMVPAAKQGMAARKDTPAKDGTPRKRGRPPKKEPTR